MVGAIFPSSHSPLGWCVSWVSCCLVASLKLACRRTVGGALVDIYVSRLAEYCWCLAFPLLRSKAASRATQASHIFLFFRPFFSDPPASLVSLVVFPRFFHCICVRFWVYRVADSVKKTPFGRRGWAGPGCIVCFGRRWHIQGTFQPPSPSCLHLHSVQSENPYLSLSFASSFLFFFFSSPFFFFLNKKLTFFLFCFVFVFTYQK